MVTVSAHPIPETGIVHQEPLTEIYVKDSSRGTGTLYITESNVLWLGASGNGLVFNYPNIAIHAVSRDTSSFPHECLFLMLDIALDSEESPMGDDDEESEEETTTDVRLVPSHKEHLDTMYQAMCTCQELHPDPEQDDSGDEFFGEGEMIGDGPVLSAQGLSNMARMERMLANGDTNGSAVHDGTTPHCDDEMEEDGQFEDA